MTALLLAGPVTAFAQEQRTFLDTSLNTVAKGDTLVVVRTGDVLVGVEWLAGAGVRDFGGRREAVGGEEFVSLASLAPAVTYTLDERDLRLAITVSPELLGRVVRDLHQGRPQNVVYRRDTSAFVNYAVTGGSDGTYDIFSETALSVRGALFSSTLTATKASLVRGLTSLTIDDRARIRRWTVGDGFATTGPLGGDTFLAGITVARDFDVDPYFVRNPTLSMTTPLAVPSVVEIHMNGRLVREEQVQPGLLDLRNLPVATGYNDTRVVVRDPFGGTRELATGFYATASGLARGIHDYQYSVGVRRTALAHSSWSYTAPAVLARHRVGVTDTITAGGRLEAAADLVSGGPVLNLRLPFGEVEAALAASRAAGTTGRAVSMSYTYGGRAFNAGATARLTGRRYATVSLLPDDPRAERELGVFAGTQAAGLGLSLQHTHSRSERPGERVRSQVVASRRVAPNAHLTAIAGRVRDAGRPAFEGSVGLTINFGSRTSTTTTVARGAQGTHTAIDIQRPLPVGQGYGFQLRTDDDRAGLPSGVLQYQGAYGRYEVRQDITPGRRQTSVTASGAIVGIGGRLFATRPVRNSFALVQVPGVKDVRGFASHHEIGRTDRHGNILVPDLLPYYANLLNIADSDIPIDYAVSRVQATVAPPFRGGAVIRFPVERIQATEGRVLLVIDGQERPPAFGELTITAGGASHASPIGASGQFYFENLPVGRHAATVTSQAGTCAFTLDVPATEGLVAKLGVLRCTATGGR